MGSSEVPNAIGVTVGVGMPFAALARIAAACFTMHTGIPTVILGEREFLASQVAHPAAIRLQVFEMVSEAIVIYFDADWFCLRNWRPPLNEELPEVYACRDFVLREEWPEQAYDFSSPDFLCEDVAMPLRTIHGDLRHDYIAEVKHFAGITLPVAMWINSGLLILNRKRHRLLLETALDYYTGSVGHHPIYYEQPALVKAIESLGIPVHLLPRRFNVLGAYESKWPESVIGLHVKAKRHERFLQHVYSGAIACPQDVQMYFRTV